MTSDQTPAPTSTEVSIPARVQMTSIAMSKRGETLTIYPWHLYLDACEHQARIALSSLRRLWKREEPPLNLAVWGSKDDLDNAWADLQSAVTAGIILSRLLKPIGVRAHNGMSKAEAQASADARGERLRALLAIPDDSALLSIGEVRNGIEHVDERIDQLVAAGDVYSVSDFDMVTGVTFVTVTREEAEAQGARGRHAVLRVFAPLAGLLTFDRYTVDLFGFETALYNLLAALPDANEVVEGERPKGPTSFGMSKPQEWAPDYVLMRRRQMAMVRAQAAKLGLR